jgi:hypothetical protein
MTVLTYIEVRDTVSPNKITVNWQQQRATVPYYAVYQTSSGPPAVYAALTAAQMASLPDDVMGSTNPLPSATGVMNRVMPLAHPIMQWLYCVGINDIQFIMNRSKSDPNAVDPPLPGAADGAELTATVGDLEVPCVPEFWLYPVVKITLDFQNLKYPLFQDSSISTIENTYYTPSGGSVVYTAPTEWWRYCNYERLPKEDVVNFKQGQINFAAQLDATHVKKPPNGAVFPGQPFFLLPNSLVTMRWEHVPYRYIQSANSFLQFYRGRVNQYAWWDWNPGELLYMGYKPTTYTQPTQSLMPWPTAAGPTGIFTAEKLVDIDLIFLETRRIGTNLPTPNFPPPGSAPWGSWNYNWIIGGHNLLPWQDRNYYYATNYMQSSGTPVANSIQVTLGASNVLNLGPPYYLSFPVELLFMDPDSPVAINCAANG